MGSKSAVSRSKSRPLAAYAAGGFAFGLLLAWVLTRHTKALHGASLQSVILEEGRSIISHKPVLNTQQTKQAKKLKGDTVHSLYTSNGSPYQNFQGRIMYGTYQEVQKMPGGEVLTGFTRILHRSTPDEVVDEIPTFRADPLEPKCDVWCDFPVKDRANAVMQWINATEKDPSLRQGAWIFMLETDYVWFRPLKVPGSVYDPAVRGMSFAYDYINPKWPGVTEILKRMHEGVDIEKVPNSGPAPVLMRFEELKAAAPLWEVYSAWIEAHNDAKETLGWVREMYAWDLAVTVANLSFINAAPPDSPLISQPPHDRQTGNACMYHYTWGSIYSKDGKEVWKFDKRFYTEMDQSLKVPKLEVPPEWQPGVKLQDGLIVTKELDDTLRDMITHMNRAIDKLPDLSAKAKPRLRI